MSETLALGIDCGGTHTDAALLAIRDSSARLLASAKTRTDHDNLPASIKRALRGLNADLPAVSRVTLGTTLAINSIVQGKSAKVALALSAGPGLDPAHFILGENACIVPGGLDHRGVEVAPLHLDELARQARQWPDLGVQACACVGKFSPRNPAHEEAMAKVVTAACGLAPTMGHTLSGRLSFPRRIATAYYNAAIARILDNFLASVQAALAEFGINAQCRLLKADGGAAPFSLARREPVQSVLSGPAASVMGCLALEGTKNQGTTLLLDIGGTTTDLALLHNSSPILARDGMEINHRRTLVRSLATISIGVGGDSLVNVQTDADGLPQISCGPLREGPAMAFGGARPTLLDALNVLDAPAAASDRGDLARSQAGIGQLASQAGFATGTELAQAAVDNAMAKIAGAAHELVAKVNARPIYTLAALKNITQARPVRAYLVGGPAHCLRQRLRQALDLPVQIPPHPDVANAIGAALTVPTAQLEIYVDTGSGRLWAPANGHSQKVRAGFTLEEAGQTASHLLEQLLAREGIDDAPVEIIEADLFATLDDHGRGAKDMRVVAQVRPGIEAHVTQDAAP